MSDCQELCLLLICCLLKMIGQSGFRRMDIIILNIKRKIKVKFSEACTFLYIVIFCVKLSNFFFLEHNFANINFFGHNID